MVVILMFAIFQLLKYMRDSSLFLSLYCISEALGNFSEDVPEVVRDMMSCLIASPVTSPPSAGSIAPEVLRDTLFHDTAYLAAGSNAVFHNLSGLCFI